MSMKLLTLLLALNLLLFTCEAKVVMPWMCLERCGGTADSIKANLQQIKDNLDCFTSVSYERYDIGYHSKLITNSFTDVTQAIKNMGLETFPMITSANLVAMKQLWADNDEFITQVVDICQNNGYTGYHIDFEATDADTKDAVDFSNFINKLANALHDIDAKLNVAMSDWSTIWDYGLVAKNTSVDGINCMATYSDSFPTFQTNLKTFMDAFDPSTMSKAGVGLQTVLDTPLSPDQLQERFDLMAQYEVEEIDIWAMPLYDYWFPFLRKFLGN